MIIVIVMMFCMVLVAVGAYLFLNRPQEGDECEVETPDDNALTYEIDDEGECVLKSCKSGYYKSGKECLVEEEEDVYIPPVVVDIPAEFRTSSGPWRMVDGRDTMKNHNTGRLDGNLWASEWNEVGKWYQMDNGKIAEIVGVAIKGRMSGADKSWGPQFVKTFKVKYYVSGVWKDVDGGATFDGNVDHDTLVEVMFATPVTTRYIRIYPQTWNKHMSLRSGLITNDTVDASAHKLLNIPADKRAASSWWQNNDSPNWHPNKGVLGSGTGWHPKSGRASDGSEWYELQMDSPTDVTGVALQGRGGDNKTKSWDFQWITTFKAQYKNTSGNWVDVDDGFVYSGCSDKESTVWVPFNTPVNTTAVRIYPKTWHRNFTGRFDLLGPSGSSEGYQIGPMVKEIQGFSFY
jgi:hypothetical protein